MEHLHGRRRPPKSSGPRISDLPSIPAYKGDGIHNRASQVAQGRSNLITLALGLGTFLTLFDVTAVVVAMPAIAKDVGFAVAGAA